MIYRKSQFKETSDAKGDKKDVTLNDTINVTLNNQNLQYTMENGRWLF
jgi:hypothetical protein